MRLNSPELASRTTGNQNVPSRPRPAAALSRARRNFLAILILLGLRFSTPHISILKLVAVPIVSTCTILATLCTCFVLFNLGEAFVANYLRPHNWNAIRDFVSHLNPRQRKLLAVEDDVSRLVDECVLDTPYYTRQMGDASTAMSHPRFPSTAHRLPDCARRPTKHVTLRATSTGHILQPCIAQSSDLRYAASNAALRQPNMMLSQRVGNVYSATATGAAQATPAALGVKLPFQLYQLSSLWSPIEQIIAGTRQVKFVTPLDTMREINVSEPDLNQWIENLREWLSCRVFRPLVQEMRQVELFLESRGWTHLSLQTHVPAVEVGGTNISSGPASFGSTMPQYNSQSLLFGAQPAATQNSFTMGGFGGASTVPAQTPYSLNSLLAVAHNESAARSRVHLERYVFISSYPLSIRRYVINRIAALARGDSLAAFEWDGGGRIPAQASPGSRPSERDSSDWNTSVPSDAELVLHIFATWMDLQMPGGRKGSAMYALFSAKYIKSLKDSKDAPENPHIQMASCHPPHYRFGLRKKIYDLFPKRNNVFAAICLFTLHSVRENSGYVDMLDIAGNAIGLGSILDT